MTVKLQIIAINKLLSDIYQQPMRLSILLKEINFTEEEINFVANRLLIEIINNFLESIEETLSNCHDGKRLFRIIYDVYGLDGNTSLTLQNIGDRLEISRERVRQLKNKAIQKLKGGNNLSLWKSSVKSKTIEILNEKIVNHNRNLSTNKDLKDIGLAIEYSFLIHQSRSGDNYITVSDNQEKNTTGQITITEETIQNFHNELIETIQSLKWDKDLKIKNKFSIEDIKKEYSRAYEKWTPEEDRILVGNFKRGVIIKEIAVILERQPSAINSRLQKLRLK